MTQPSKATTVTTILNDRVIRDALVKHLATASFRPKALLEELRVHNGKAVADVVAVHSAAHCYEIKGETDSINRVRRQAGFYDLAFERITLVTTANHLPNATRIVPPYWGLMTVSRNPEGGIVFRHARGAKVNTTFCKTAALLTLWKEELSKLATDLDARKFNRALLSEYIASNSSRRQVAKFVGSALLERHASAG